MGDNIQNNPFSALFPSTKDAQLYQQEQVASNVAECSAKTTVEPKKVNNEVLGLMEEIFMVTTNSSGLYGSSPCLVLTDALELSLENVGFVLFERLLYNTDEAEIRWPSHTTVTNMSSELLNQVKRQEVVVYLVEVYERCWKQRHSAHQDVINKLFTEIITNLSTVLEQPELFSSQNPVKQFEDVIYYKLATTTAVENLLRKYVIHLKEQNSTIPGFFNQIIEKIKKELSLCSLVGVNFQLIDMIEIFSTLPMLSTLLTHKPEGSTGSSGGRYQNTILGSLLSISVLPKHISQPYEYFNKPLSQSQQAHKSTEQSIWTAQSNLHTRIHAIFLNLLKAGEESKTGLLRWIEDCLSSNSGRSGYWHLEAGGLQAMLYVSDGFMINLGAVMLKLAAPFSKDITSGSDVTSYKIMKVDPTYCIANNSRDGVYCGDLSKQTTLIPCPEGTTIDVEPSDNYSFITTCFYLTHRALHLGLQVVYQKLYKLYQELDRLQREYRTLSEQNSPTADMLRKHVENRTTHYLSLQAAAFQTQMIEGLLEFLSATSYWLIQVALSKRSSTPKNNLIAPTTTTLPLPEDSSKLLMCIPEFIVETLVESVRTLNRFRIDSVYLSSEHFMNQLMSLIIVFMGSSSRVYNPHLRAHLADCLAGLISDSSKSRSFMGNTRERLFLEHPLRDHLVTSLIQVFVSIEMTSQSVQFEEKFNYKRPMYEALKYLWEIKEHRTSFVTLANQALANMEAATAPLFLRFVNLLINDAIFLLDEGLAFMMQIKEQQTEQERGDWYKLTPKQKLEKERNLQHITLMAKFHNMLGTSNIEVLIRLSKEISHMMTHSTLVDRIAAMLNHFLQHLVGPKQKNLKVKDRERYEFRPSEVVSNICTLYINLGNDPSFCLAVCSDGRSYSPELFVQACDVLNRIFHSELSEKMKAVGEKVEEVGKRRQEDEDLATLAPEEFLDPIMSHLMTDPVILPTSNVSCDRSTIARHLLSDQIDPFNRKPLTMEEVIPNTELKNKITEWITAQKESNRKGNT